jgi:hypothetical protein
VRAPFSRHVGQQGHRGITQSSPSLSATGKTPYQPSIRKETRRSLTWNLPNEKSSPTQKQSPKSS